MLTRRRTTFTHAVAALVLLGAAGCGPARATTCAALIDAYAAGAGGTVASAEHAFALGVCFYRGGQHREAAGMFDTAAQLSNQPRVDADALHNLGNAAALGGRMDAALEAYRASLRLQDRETTRRNFEIVMARAAEAGRRAQTAAQQERDDRLLDEARRFELPVPRDRRPGGHRQAPDW